MFKIGDVVCCVDPDQLGYLKLNGVYRVSSVGHKGRCVQDNKPDYGVRLYGILTAEYAAFDPRRFKHLPKADDTFINQMRSLKPAKEKTRVA